MQEVLNDSSDRDAVARLVEAGVDVSKPQSIDFHIAATSDESATRILSALESLGYNASIYRDEGEPDESGFIDPRDPEFGPSWTVTAVITLLPTVSELIRVQSQLNEIARPLGGYSDGWGMMHTPN
jgi:hypothetical protein